MSLYLFLIESGFLVFMLVFTVLMLIGDGMFVDIAFDIVHCVGLSVELWLSVSRFVLFFLMLSWPLDFASSIVPGRIT